MCFSNEQKNKDVKKHGKISYQRVNLPWTLLSKQVMKYNRFIMNHRNGFPDIFEYKINPITMQFNDLEKNIP